MTHAHPTDARLAPRRSGAPTSSAVATAILEAFATGTVSIRELAQRHGIGEATVRAILRGERHADAPGPRLSPERIAELGRQHHAEGRRRAGRSARDVCPGCGGTWHPITACGLPSGR